MGIFCCCRRPQNRSPEQYEVAGKPSDERTALLGGERAETSYDAAPEHLHPKIADLIRGERAGSNRSHDSGVHSMPPDSPQARRRAIMSVRTKRMEQHEFNKTCHSPDGRLELIRGFRAKDVFGVDMKAQAAAFAAFEQFFSTPGIMLHVTSSVKATPTVHTHYLEIDRFSTDEDNRRLTLQACRVLGFPDTVLTGNVHLQFLHRMNLDGAQVLATPELSSSRILKKPSHLKLESLSLRQAVFVALNTKVGHTIRWTFTRNNYDTSSSRFSRTYFDNHTTELNPDAKYPERVLDNELYYSEQTEDSKSESGSASGDEGDYI